LFILYICFFFQAEDGIRDRNVTGVQTCALPISNPQLYYPISTWSNRVLNSVGLTHYISNLYILVMHSAESHPTAPPDSDGSSNASLRPLANQMVAAASRFARTATQISGIRISAVSMRALAYIERHGPQRISHLANYESIS